MSGGRLLALLGSAPSFIPIGEARHGEFTSNIVFNADARPGDYAIFMFFPARNISGGSATPWRLMTGVANGKATIAHRRLEASDFNGSLTLNDVSPVISYVWRGVSNAILRQSSTANAGSFGPVVNGFVKSANSAALACCAYDENGGIDHLKAPPFGTTHTAGPLNYRFGMAVTRSQNYADNSDLSPIGANLAGERSVSVIELLA